ncbi:hypothetical protein RBSWK_02047 [Rhodopirellula baltica SWK14]|uniref:Uncharacterized protein n=1 Tax=Rhodopirellula baltica SWK14 TaxID=993516 RepID=L7CLH1_RHOBT|nr:hypothetical protein RBSWK_02047 [Rhodopirellula baltica SWK14]
MGAIAAETCSASSSTVLRLADGLEDADDLRLAFFEPFRDRLTFV